MQLSVSVDMTIKVFLLFGVLSTLISKKNQLPNVSCQCMSTIYSQFSLKNFFIVKKYNRCFCKNKTFKPGNISRIILYVEDCLSFVIIFCIRMTFQRYWEYYRTALIGNSCCSNRSHQHDAEILKFFFVVRDPFIYLVH